MAHLLLKTTLTDGGRFAALKPPRGAVRLAHRVRTKGEEDSADAIRADYASTGAAGCPIADGRRAATGSQRGGRVR